MNVNAVVETRIRAIVQSAETEHDLFFGHPLADVSLRCVGGGVAVLNLEGGLVGAAMLGAAQGPDGAGDGRIDVRPVPAITRAVKVEALNSCSA